MHFNPHFIFSQYSWQKENVCGIFFKINYTAFKHVNLLGAFLLWFGVIGFVDNKKHISALILKHPGDCLNLFLLSTVYHNHNVVEDFIQHA